MVHVSKINLIFIYFMVKLFMVLYLSIIYYSCLKLKELV